MGWHVASKDVGVGLKGIVECSMGEVLLHPLGNLQIDEKRMLAVHQRICGQEPPPPSNLKFSGSFTLDAFVVIFAGA